MKCNLVDYVGGNNEVALKMLFNFEETSTNNLTAEFKSEWELIYGNLPPHQNIIRIMKVFTATIPQKIRDAMAPLVVANRSAKFIAMEYHPITLKKYLTASIPIQERFRFCQEIAEGLFYLFQNNIIHGDMKLDNILVSKEGTIVITDFGTSFCAKDSKFTHVRGIQGNIAHLAPEINNTSIGKSVSYLKQPTWELGVLIFEVVHFSCDKEDNPPHPFGADYPYPKFARERVSVAEYNVIFTTKDFGDNFVDFVKLMLKDFDERTAFPEAVSQLKTIKI